MAVAAIDLYDMFLDLNGVLNAGGKVYTYQSGTTTPLATYADKDGSGANPNPILLDASGETKIWLARGASYKFVFTDPSGVVLYTKDGIGVDASTPPDPAFDLSYYFLGGPPIASQELFRYVFDRSVDFPADFTGSMGSTAINPTASFVETLAKNGVTVGTITTNTSGISVFASTAGASVSFVAGDLLTITAPATVDATVSGLARTFAGSVA